MKTIPPGPAAHDEHREPVPEPVGNGHGRYTVEGGALCAYTREGKPYGILPAERFEVKENVRIVGLTPDRSEGATESSAYTLIYQGTREESVVETQIPTADLRDARSAWPEESGVALHLPPSKHKKVADAIAALAQTAPTTLAISGTGPFRTPQGYVFLRQGKPALSATGFDGRYQALIPSATQGVRTLDFADPSPEASALEDFEQYLRIGDLTPGQPGIALAMLGALAWAPAGVIQGFGNLCVLVFADSGSLKTACAGLLVAAQSTRDMALGPGKDPQVQSKMRNNQSTVYGNDVALSALGGSLALIDDLFADKKSARVIDETWKRLSAIVDNISTGEGGTRGGRFSGMGSSNAKSYYPRSSGIFTAEELPDEAGHTSTTGRTVALEMTTSPDRQLLTQLQDAANRGVLAGAHSTLIQRSLPDFELHRWAYRTARDRVDTWNMGGHARGPELYAKVLAGLYVASAVYGQLAECDPRMFGDSAVEAIREVAARQAQRSGIRKGKDVTRDPVRIFLAAARTALREGKVFLAGQHLKGDGDAAQNYEIPRVKGVVATALGWRPGGALDFTPPSGAAIGAIITYAGRGARPAAEWETRAFVTTDGWRDLYRVTAKMTVDTDGWSLPAPEALLAKLAEAGVARSADREKAKIWDGQTWGYSLRIDALLTGEVPLPGDGPEDTPDGPEPGAPAPDQPAQPELLTAVEPQNGRYPARDTDKGSSPSGDEPDFLADHSGDEPEGPARPAWMPGEIKRNAEGGVTGVFPAIRQLLREQEKRGRTHVQNHPYPDAASVPEPLRLLGKHQGTSVHDGTHAFEASRVRKGQQVTVLDRNAAYLAAMSRLRLPICGLEPFEGEGDPKLTGIYRLTRKPKLLNRKYPHPLGDIKAALEGEPLWIARPTLDLLREAAKAGIAEEPVVAGSLLGVPLAGGSATAAWDWIYRELRDARSNALANGDVDAVDFVKSVYALMTATAGESTYNTDIWRPEIPVIIRAAAAANTWRIARKITDAGLRVVALKNSDAIHVAANREEIFALESTPGKPLLTEGRELNQIKVSKTYTAGDEK